MNIAVLYSKLNYYCLHRDFQIPVIEPDHINKKEFQKSIKMLHKLELKPESLLLNIVSSKKAKYPLKVQLKSQKNQQKVLIL